METIPDWRKTHGLRLSGIEQVGIEEVHNRTRMLEKRSGRTLRINGSSLLICAYGLSAAVKPPEQLAALHKQPGIGGIQRQSAVDFRQRIAGGCRPAYFP